MSRRPRPQVGEGGLGQLAGVWTKHKNSTFHSLPVGLVSAATTTHAGRGTAQRHTAQRRGVTLPRPNESLGKLTTNSFTT